MFPIMIFPLLCLSALAFAAPMTTLTETTSHARIESFPSMKNEVSIKHFKVPPCGRHRYISQAGKNSFRHNICLILDGSAEISEKTFYSQKRFILQLLGRMNTRVPFNATVIQNGYSVVFSGATDFQKAEKKLKNVKKLGNRDYTRAGINLCFRRLSQTSGEFSLLVVLGDGRTHGENAVHAANRVRWQGAEMWSVGAGNYEYASVMALAGWNRRRLYDASSVKENEKRIRFTVDGWQKNIADLKKPQKC